MDIYKHTFRNGKVLCFLRPAETIIGKWAIETRLFNKSKWEKNVNLPLFETKEQAEEYLRENCKENAAE